MTGTSQLRSVVWRLPRVFRKFPLASSVGIYKAFLGTTAGLTDTFYGDWKYPSDQISGDEDGVRFYSVAPSSLGLI